MVGSATASGNSFTVSLNQFSAALTAQFPDNGIYTFYLKTVDAAGNSSSCYATQNTYRYRAWSRDSGYDNLTKCEYRTTIQNPYSVKVKGMKIYVGNPDDRGYSSSTSCPSYDGAHDYDQHGSVTYYELGNITQNSYIKGPGTAGALFGFSIGVSDNELLSGAPGVSTAYLYSGYTLTQTFTAVNHDSTDRFGEHVEFERDTIAIGAPNEDAADTGILNGATASSDESSTDAGAIYIYHRYANSWTQQAYIKAWNQSAGQKFGQQFKYGKNRLVVLTKDSSCSVGIQNTANPVSSVNNCSDRGAIHVYSRNSSQVWSYEAYIKPANANYNFVHGLAFSNNTIAVQRDDAKIDIYILNSGQWQLQTTLQASNLVEVQSHTSAFGYELDMSNEQLAVMYSADRSQSTSVENSNIVTEQYSTANAKGAVYLFQRKNQVWSQIAHLKKSASTWADGVQKNQISSISLDDGYLFVAHQPTGTTGESAVASDSGFSFYMYSGTTAVRITQPLPQERSNLTSFSIYADTYPGIVATTYGERFAYKYGLQANVDCADQSGYSAHYTNKNFDFSAYADNDELRICLLGSYQLGTTFIQDPSEATVIDWVKDTSY